jgi:hypothetical protein
MKFIKPETILNKQDECDFLDELCKAFDGKDLYLNGLFTRPFTTEIQQRIWNDFPCDILAELQDCERRETDKISQIAMLESKVNQVNNAAIDCLQEKSNIIMQQMESLNQMTNRFNQSNDHGLEMLAEMNQLQSALSNREMEICQLKAKLYDLDHK